MHSASDDRHVAPDRHGARAVRVSELRVQAERRTLHQLLLIPSKLAQEHPGDGAIDAEQLRHLVDAGVRHGTAGLLVQGSEGRLCALDRRRVGKAHVVVRVILVVVRLVVVLEVVVAHVDVRHMAVMWERERSRAAQQHGRQGKLPRLAGKARVVAALPSPSCGRGFAAVYAVSLPQLRSSDPVTRTVTTSS